MTGTSLGAFIATELAASRPDMVTCCVLMATRARADAFRRALSAGETVLTRDGIQLPPSYDAAISVLQMFSPATLNDLLSDRRDALRAVPVGASSPSRMTSCARRTWSPR